jgi:hypothetical protein
MTSVREITVKAGLGVHVPPGSAFAIETPPMLPKMHFLAAVVGKRGSGKGVATVSLLSKMPIDRLIYVSPSVQSNSTLLNTLSGMLRKEDLYGDVNDVKLLDKIISVVERERDDYEKYHRDLKAMNAKPKTNSLFQFSDDGYQASTIAPKHRWNGRVPVICVYFDDILGSKLLSGGAREVSRLCMYHRHLGGFSDPKRGGALGISIVFNVQSWKTSVGGIPPALRANMTLMILFKTQSEKELKDLSESVNGEITPKQFLDMCEAAWKNSHDFLLIDLHPKPNHPSGFRRNFDTFLLQ